MKHEAHASQEVGPRPEMSAGGWQRLLPGLEQLWHETRGERSITIAVLDGAVDLSHPCFESADLRGVESVVPAEPPSHHGTGVASILVSTQPLEEPKSVQISISWCRKVTWKKKKARAV